MYRNDYGMDVNSSYAPYSNPTAFYSDTMNQNDDRFLFPFLVGGVAGGALGYGIANNNNNNNPQVFYPFPPAPMNYPQYPMYNQPYPIYYSCRNCRK